jgi:hypothetical protein
MGMPFGSALRMPVNVVRGRSQSPLVETVEVDVEDAGLVVIEPHRCACLGRHG